MRISILLFAVLFSINVKACIPDSTRLQSVEGIINYSLELISVKPGEPVDTAAMRNLYLPKAQLAGLSYRNGQTRMSNLTIDEFVKMANRIYSARGFKETELKSTIDEYNNIAQVFQSYQIDIPGLKERGINAYQLVYHKDRWWIASIIWSSDANGVVVPEQYLPKK